MDTKQLAAALTEHIPDGDVRKTRIAEGLVILKDLCSRESRPAMITISRYTIAGLVRLVTRSHAMDVPIRRYATDLHEFWVDALGVQPDGVVRKKVGEAVSPRYQEADPEADAVAHLIDIFQEKY
jgi:hypothetical protein